MILRELKIAATKFKIRKAQNTSFIRHHRLRFKVVLKNYNYRTQEIETWCDENIVGMWLFDNWSYGTYRFQTQEDALAFKLRWN